MMLLEQLFDPAYRVRFQKHISTHGTDVSRDVVNDQQLPSVPYRMRYTLRFVRAGASVNTALHRECLLRVATDSPVRVDAVVPVPQLSLKFRHIRHLGQ